MRSPNFHGFNDFFEIQKEPWERLGKLPTSNGTIEDDLYMEPLPQPPALFASSDAPQLTPANQEEPTAAGVNLYLDYTGDTTKVGDIVHRAVTGETFNVYKVEDYLIPVAHVTRCIWLKKG
jgi:hypothetical protein